MSVDQYYTDSSGALHFLSAQDQTNAAAHGLPLPDPSWTAVTAAQASAIQNPPPTLAQSQAAQLATLSTACANAITAAFASSALGSPNSYGCDAETQSNISYAALHGGSLWCSADGQSWAFTAHTTDQAALVQADMWSHVQGQQAIYAGLVAQVNAATTPAAVQAIAWP